MSLPLDRPANIHVPPLTTWLDRHFLAVTWVLAGALSATVWWAVYTVAVMVGRHLAGG